MCLALKTSSSLSSEPETIIMEKKQKVKEVCALYKVTQLVIEGWKNDD